MQALAGRIISVNHHIIMGIDIYTRYLGQTPEERNEQSSHWLCTDGGQVGYPREAYHGEPYVTRFLCREAFTTGEAAIPAWLLRKRLAKAVRLVAVRERALYPDESEEEIQAICDSYTAFVEHCERIEAMIGEPVIIVVSY